MAEFIIPCLQCNNEFPFDPGKEPEWVASGGPITHKPKVTKKRRYVPKCPHCGAENAVEVET